MHGPVVDDFIMWCQNTFLKLYVSKTKEMTIDFNSRRKSTHDKQTSINGVGIESIEQYMYLDTVLDNKLSFSPNTEVLCKRGQQRLYCLRKLRSFNVDKTLMCMFYRSYSFQVSSFKFYLSHTRLYRDCTTSSEMRVGSAPWTVQILKKQHKGSKHKIR